MLAVSPALGEEGKLVGSVSELDQSFIGHARCVRWRRKRDEAYKRLYDMWSVSWSVH